MGGGGLYRPASSNHLTDIKTLSELFVPERGVEGDRSTTLTRRQEAYVGRIVNRLQEELEGVIHVLHHHLDILGVTVEMFLHALELCGVLFAVVILHPARRAVVKRLAELRRSNMNVVRDFMHSDTFPTEVAFLLHGMNGIVHRLAVIDLSPDHYNLVVNLQPSVVFYRDVVGDELTLTLVVQVVCVDSFLHAWCLEVALWQHDVVKHLIEDLWLAVLEMTLELLLDVLEDGLDGVAVRITFQAKRVRHHESVGLIVNDKEQT